MKKLLKYLLLAILSLSFVVGSLLPCYAESVNMNRKGSLTLDYFMEERPVKGEPVALFRVANIDENAVPTWTDEIQNLNLNLKLDLKDEKSLKELPEKLKSALLKVNPMNLDSEGKVKDKTDEKGRIVWEDLQVGMYLVVPSDWSGDEGSYDVSPMLVSIPYNDIKTKEISYDATVNLKHELIEKPTKPTVKPTSTPKPVIVKKTLPQTGMLQWPIKVLAGCAIGLFLIAVVICSVDILKGKKGTKLQVFCLVLLLVSIGCAIGAFSLENHNQQLEHVAGENASSVLVELDSQIHMDKTGESQTPEKEDNSERIATIDGVPYLGKLSIPAIEIELPVVAEWQENWANIGPCRYKGTILDNNIIIAGHNYITHFGKLDNLVKGDSISFIDVDNVEYKYTVESNELIEGTDVEKMESGDWDLTLFTCDYSGNNRYTVRCKLAK